MQATSPRPPSADAFGVSADAPLDERPPPPPKRGRGALQWALAAFGVLLLAALVYQAGPRRLAGHLVALGAWAPIIFVPYAVAAAFDAAGWRATFVPLRPSFWLLYVVRLVGEALNSITPAAYMGGEPVKAYVLHRFGVPLTDAATSVILAKTALTIAQIAFVILGLALFFVARGATPGDLALLAGAIAMGAAVAALLVRWQRRGLVASVVRLARKILPRAQFLIRLEERAPAIDERLRSFYRDRKADACASVLWHLLGWIAGAGEVFAIMVLIGHPVSWRDAIVIEALAQPARLVGLIVPATLGVQEAGGMLIFRLLGFAPELGLTLMLLKRVREIGYSLLGLALLPRLRPRA
jgi:putative membrane protein